MFALYAPSASLSSLLYRSLASSSPTLSLIHTLTFTKQFSSHSRRSSPCNVAAMSGPNSTARDSTLEHVSCSWYSVPELRLRDHRFSVPLDYSLDLHSTPRISVFAREVVAGTVYSRTIVFYWCNKIIDFSCIHFQLVDVVDSLLWRLYD